MATLVSSADLQARLSRHPGLIPVELDPLAENLLWMDLGEYHCYQGLFDDAVTRWKAFHGSPISFPSRVEVLRSLEAPTEGIPPSGFIFHSGRCGSTLLAQVLARSRENLVIAEASAHNRFWRLPSGADAELYRKLILAMGRRRLASYRAHLVKFTSYNILRFRRIRDAFPDVPALFLFREPGSVLRSYRRDLPRWIARDMAVDAPLETPETALESFFRAALSIGDDQFRCLDYARLNQETLPHVLAFFRLNPSAPAAAQMIDGFRWDAVRGDRPFVPRSPAEGDPVEVPPSLTDLYERLRVRQPLL